jgi:hypothetical protein
LSNHVFEDLRRTKAPNNHISLSSLLWELRIRHASYSVHLLLVSYIPKHASVPLTDPSKILWAKVHVIFRNIPENNHYLGVSRTFVGRRPPIVVPHGISSFLCNVFRPRIN